MAYYSYLHACCATPLTSIIPSLYYFQVSLCLYNVSMFVHESCLLITTPPSPLSQELEVKFNSYQNMKKMLTTKNTSIAELRTNSVNTV